MTADAVGGVWSYILALAHALAPHDVRVTLAALGPPPSAAQRADALAVPGLSLVHRPYKLEWMDDSCEDVSRSGEWLAELDEAVRPDVVHLNGYALAARSWRAPVIVVAHSCVLSWWEAVRGESAPATWDRYAAAVARGVQSADLVVAPTAAMLASIEAHYGRRSATAVIPNATSAARFAPHSKEPFVLAAGRVWDEAKNIGALDAVAATLPWPVYVAGDSRHPGGGRQAMRSAHALGALPASALASWMARAAIYALPARYEPFGLSALEAGLAGCALVLGDIPSLREVWGDAASFVAPDDGDALRHSLGALMADHAARANLGARALSRALTYTPQRMAASYLAQYERLACEPAVAVRRAASA